MEAHRSESLESIKMLRTMSESDRDAVIAHMERLELTTGAVLFAQGEEGNSMVVVVDGILRVEVSGADGSSQTVATIQSGEVVGEMSVIDPAPRSASVVAASDVTVLRLTRAQLTQLRDSSPSAAAAVVSSIISDVTKRLRKVNKRIEQELDPLTDSFGHALTKTKLAPKAETPPDEGFFSNLWRRIRGESDG